MTREQFIAEIKARNEWKVGDRTLKYIEVYKGTKKMVGISIRKDVEVISPTVYVESFWERGDEDIAFEDVESKVIDIADKNAKDNIKLDFKLENVVPCLVNSKAVEFLKDKPHRTLVGDVVVYYRLKVDIADDGFVGSAPVNNSLMKFLGVSGEEELFDNAVKNMSPLKVNSMRKVLMEMMMGIEDAPDDEDDKLFVASNDSKMYGAAQALIDTRSLKDMADKYESDILIIPSSIHECLYVPAASSGPNAEDLAQMVREVNATQVKEEERLSDHMFKYDRVAGEIIVAS